jgi:hypothetical protein
MQTIPARVWAQWGSRLARIERCVKICKLQVAVLAYLLLDVVISPILGQEPPWMLVRSVVSLPLILLLPLLFGRFIRRAIGVRWDDFLVGMLVADWLVGIFSLMSVACTLQALSLHTVLRQLYAIALLVALSECLATMACRVAHRQVSNRVYHSIIEEFGGLVGILGPTIIGLCLSILTRYYTPFLSAGEDWMGEATYQAAFRITNTGFLTMDARVPNILLVALVTSAASLSDPMAIVWAGPLLLTPLALTGAYLFCYKLTRHKHWSVLASFFAGILNVGSTVTKLPEGILVIQYMKTYRSDTILYALYPLLVSTILVVAHEARVKKSVGSYLGGLAVFWLLHGELGIAISFYDRNYFWDPIIILLALCAFMVFLRVWRPRSVITSMLFLVAFLFPLFNIDGMVLGFSILLFTLIALLFRRWGTARASFICVIAAVYVVLNYFDVMHFATETGSPIFPMLILAEPFHMFFTNQVKLNALIAANGPVTLSLVSLGVVSNLWDRKPEKIATAVATASLFLVYLLPYAVLYRTYMTLTVFMAYMVVSGLATLYRLGRRLGDLVSTRTKMRTLGRHVIPTVLVCIVVLYAAFPMLYVVVRRAQDSPSRRWTDYEYETGRWIRDHTPHAIVISDFRSMQIMTALGDKIWLPTAFTIETLGDSGNNVLELVKFEIFLAPNSSSAYQNLFKNWRAPDGIRSLIPLREQIYMRAVGIVPQDLVFLVVLSARTVEWIEYRASTGYSSGVWEISYPTLQSVDRKYRTVFEDPRYFKLIFWLGDQIFVYQAAATVPASAIADGVGELGSEQQSLPLGTVVNRYSARSVKECVLTRQRDFTGGYSG